MKDNIEENRFDALAEKWLTGNITDAEAKEYADWYNSEQDNPVEIPPSFASNRQELKNRILLNVFKTAKARNHFISYKKNLYIAAAIFLFFIGIYLYQYLPSTNKRNIDSLTVSQVKSKIVSGGNRAVLTLSNGQKIALNSSIDGIVAKETDSKIVKTADGAIVYEKGNNLASENVAQNTLSTPRGGTYNITLSDGTKIWLNAASSIQYPSAFTGKERIVHLTGEAYFEVKHNAKQPFKVFCRGQVVEDLGTKFDINSYKEEGVVKTTLLQGSVKLINAENKEKYLQPGQQAVLAGNNITIRTVNVNQEIAWKNDLFEFDNIKIQSIMNMVARWYDVNIIYQGAVTKEGFVGVVSRFSNVSDVLNVLELTGKVHFDIKGKTIIVLP